MLEVNQLEWEKWIDKLPKVISSSREHANEVCGRSHIKGARLDRVNHFVTTLRRELNVICNPYYRAILTSKALWYDAGVLESYLPTYPYIRYRGRSCDVLPIEKLKEAVMESYAFDSEPEEAVMIKKDLVTLKGSLCLQTNQIDQMDNLLTRSESVSTRIVDLLTKIGEL